LPDVGGIAGARLKSLIERIERLEEEQKAINEDKKEVYAEARGTGFDVKVMKKLIAIRRKDQDALDEEETLLDVYKRALGMIPDLPSDEPEGGTVVATRVRAPGPRLAEVVAGEAASRAADTSLKSAVRQTIKDAGFVETAPGQFRAPASESAEPF
jgi:uncharacterized protein (UPF0335 family)